jgi:hypothetical protein
MNEIQKQVFIGSMLGDGYILNNKNNTYNFCKKQKSTRKEYLDWHFLIFENLGCRIDSGQQQLTFEYYRLRNQEFISKYCIFSTHSNTEFFDECFKWYKNQNGIFDRNKNNQKIKIIPNDINLMPLSMAVCFLFFF